MILEKLREEISELCEEAMLFDNPSYDKSIIGITLGGNVVYDYNSMIEEFAEENNCSYDEALDFVDYNTVRSLNYISDEMKPIVITDLQYE